MTPCGFRTRNGPCTELGDGRCEEHAQSRWAVCTCGRPASAECGVSLPGGAPCGKAICEACVHVSGTDDHTPMSAAFPDVDVPEPHPLAAHRAEVFNQLASIIGASLQRMVEEGALVLPAHVEPQRVAARIVQDAGAHVLLGVLAGMGMAQ